ncbi:hypothetical protein [Sorangium atrum]|uniref:Lipoprotein n=1 Tax=Sorangium atrum TaxID=2995308 RepID=A0ABT5C983_9BACT|nr:hypothetical protein [Sorangium aterium]MDC0682940.1 hypothetical protein [Sorangium aterium]
MTHDIKSAQGTLLEGQDDCTVARPKDDRRGRSGGKGRGMRLLAKLGGMIAVLASTALAGCIAQEGDEALSDEALSEETVEEAEQALQVGLTSVTCNSGWPGTRGCFKQIVSATDIVPGTVTAQVDGHNGAVGFSASQTGPRTIDFSASIREGDAFNSGKNTTKFLVTWVRQ